jgi:hypothetical protein
MCNTAGGAGETSCTGDSGGPLVCELDGRWYQVSDPPYTEQALGHPAGGIWITSEQKFPVQATFTLP